MKLLVIGGVAAGTKVAAKYKRVMPEAEVTIVTKGRDISYAGCGLPYYIGEVIEGKDQLIVNTPAREFLYRRRERLQDLTAMKRRRLPEICVPERKRFMNMMPV